MQITLDTNNIDPKQAREFAAFLIALFGEPARPITVAVPTATESAPPAPPSPATLESAVFAPPTSPVPAVSAPMPLTAPPSPAGTPGVDVHGRVWDERVHSSSKEFNKDGSWRARRNLDPAVLAAYNAEVGLPAAPVAVAAAAPPAVVAAPPAPPPGGYPVPVAAAPPPATDVQRFQAVMQKVTAGVAAGKFSMIDVTNQVQQLGLQTVAQVLQQPANIDPFDALIDGLSA